MEQAIYRRHVRVRDTWEFHTTPEGREDHYLCREVEVKRNNMEDKRKQMRTELHCISGRLIEQWHEGKAKYGKSNLESKKPTLRENDQLCRTLRRRKCICESPSFVLQQKIANYRKEKWDMLVYTIPVEVRGCVLGEIDRETPSSQCPKHIYSYYSWYRVH